MNEQRKCDTETHTYNGVLFRYKQIQNYLTYRKLLLNEIRQIQKDISHFFSHVWNLDKKGQGSKRETIRVM
jgi:iron uptake system EfeUOB component EfeO/EfeM